MDCLTLIKISNRKKKKKKKFQGCLQQNELKTQKNKGAMYTRAIDPAHRHPITYKKNSQILLSARSPLKRLKPVLFKAFPRDLTHKPKGSFKVLSVV